MSGAMGVGDSAVTKIEVREIRISADYRHDERGQIVEGSWKMLRQYAVIVDGRRVDSFMSRSRAETRAEQLREKAAGR